MKNILLTLLCALALTAAATPDKKPSSPQRGYRIVLSISGNTDSVMYLGNYYAGSTYATDTARRDSKGRFVFERKDRPVFPGLYFFASPGGRHVDFVIYNETPNFTFTTSDDDWTRGMKVKGSRENELFFRYHHLNSTLYDRIDSAARLKTDEAAFQDFRRQQLRQLDSIKINIIDQNPHSFVALMMNATREPDVPLTSPQGDTLNRRQVWEYYMEHYFDYMRLDDDAIVRTPEAIFKKRILDYFDRNLKGADPETIIHYVDLLVERARPARETYKWIVHTITEKYLQSPVMSYDAIYVHMIKTYYATGQTWWSSPSSIDLNIKRADKWDRLLIGKAAIDLVMKDDNDQIHQLYALRSKYTLLIFWSPTCGHCKTIIPELYQRFLSLREHTDIAAYAILSEPDEPTIPKWRDFIATHHMTDPHWLNLNGAEANVDWHDVYDIETTPQIYLLDRDKVILAKKLNAETLEMIIRQIEGLQ